MDVPGNNGSGAPKRPYNTRSQTQNKRAKHKHSSGKLIDDSEKIVAKIINVNEAKEVSKNCVWLNQKDIASLKLKLDDPFVRIADRVYKVITAKWIKPGFVGLTSVQKEEILDEGSLNDDNSVLISPFLETPYNYQVLTSATFTIGHINDDDFYNEESVVIDAAKLSNYVQKLYKGHFFKFDQGVYLCFENQNLFLTLESGKGLKKPSSHEFFNQLTSRTKLFFKTIEHSQFVIVNKQPISSDYFFTFNISLKTDEKKDKDDNKKVKVISLIDLIHRSVNNRSSSLARFSLKKIPTPPIFSVDNLKRTIQEKLEGKLINEGTTQIFMQDGLEIKVKLTDVATAGERLSSLVRIQDQTVEYPKAFYLNADSNIKLTSTNSLVLTEGDPIVATKVIFKIDEAHPYRSKLIERSDNHWICTPSIIHKIRRHLKEFVLSTRFKIEDQGVSYQIEVRNVHYPKDESAVKEDYHKFWVMGNHTNIELWAHPLLNKVLVADDEPYSLKKVRLKVESDAFGKKDKSINIDKEKLQREIIHSMPQKVCVGQKFYVDLGHRERIQVTVEHMGFNNQKISESKENFLGYVDEKTELEFKGQDVSIITNIPPISIDDPIKVLEQLGLAGLSDEQVKLVKGLLLLNGPIKEHAEKIGYKPPKGILLYGPPGTGKTTFAKEFIRKYLGVPESRIKWISGGEVKNKWLGVSEKKVRELFEDAKKAGKDGPLHIIIIDEADSAVGKMRDGDNHQHKITNEFKAQMDGIDDMNALVILITNHPDRIDSAILRHGRMDIKIEFGLPDRKGRKAIFGYHTRKISENGMLSPDVNFDLLSEMTNGLAGADIKGIVDHAREVNVLRYHTLKLKSTDEPAKINMDDLLLGFKKVVMALKEDSPLIPDLERSKKFQALTPRNALMKLGPVGLPENAIDIVESIVWAYGKGNEHNKKIGLRPPRGLLLYGRPGTGKSTLGKSIIQMLGVPQHRVTIKDAADIKREMISDKNKDLRDYFSIAKKASESPDDADQLSIVMIENIDHLGESLISQLFARLDELKNIDNLLVIATSNILDITKRIEKHHTLQHFTIPGRFRKTIKFEAPDYKQRIEILKFHTKQLKKCGMLHKDVDLENLSSMTEGFSGSHIESFVRDAKSFNASRVQKAQFMDENDENKKVKMDDFRMAFKRDNVPERKIGDSRPPELVFS